MTLSTYQTGTATVSVGGTTVTGSGTIWTGGNAREGDVIVIGDASAMVLAVVSATELTITPWPGSAETDASYTIYQTSPRRFDTVEVADDLRKQVSALNDAEYFVLVKADQNEPDPSLGDEDQWALQKSTGKMWIKTGGVWVPAGNFRGIKPDFTVPEIEDRDAHDDDPTGTIVLVASEGAIYVKLSAASGDWSDAVPLKGEKGDQGDTATVEVGTVTTGVPGSAADVTNSGDEHAAVLDFTIPRGATVTVGSTTTGAAGSNAAVTDSGTGGDVVLDFTIPIGKGYGGTSDTELTISTGNQSFDIEAGLAFVVGDRVHIGATSAPLNWMEGFVTAYASTSMTVAVSDVGGSGTFDAWGIGLTGKPGTGDGDMKAAVYDPIIDDLANGQSGNAAAISAVSGGVTALQSYVLQRKFSGCMIYRNSDSSAIFASGATTKVPFTHASYDYDNWWDISDDDDFWVPDLPGLVAVKCTASLFVANGDASGAASETRFAVNGSVPIGGGFDVRSDGGRFYLVSAIFPGLSYGDKISLEFYHTAGKSLAVAATYTWAAVEGIFSPE